MTKLTFKELFLQYPSPLTTAAGGIVISLWTLFVFAFITITSCILSCYQVVKQALWASGGKDHPAPKVVLITGGSNGLGAGLAATYAKKGAETIYITGRNTTALNDTIANCKKVATATNFSITAVVVDVTDKEQMKTELQKIDASTPIDVVICNAGISPEQQKHKAQEDIYRDTYEVNITGILNTIFPLHDAMIARKTGHIVLISSLASFASIAHPSYSSCKALVTMLGQGLRRDMREHNINVTTICPGFVRTNMTIARHEAREGGLPFYQELEPSCEAMYNAVANNIDVFAFPFPMFVLAWACRFVPFHIMDALGLFLAKLMYRAPEGSIPVVAPKDAVKEVKKVD